MIPSNISPETLPVGHSQSAASDQQNNHGRTENTANTYPEPPPELIAEIRKRLADIPQETVERAHEALRHASIDTAGSILYRAGICLCSAELREYRKTLFPPNAIVDPLTNDSPVLRTDVGSADSLSASAPPTGDQPSELSNLKSQILLPDPLTSDKGPSRESETQGEPITTDAPHLTDVTHLTHSNDATLVTDSTDVTHVTTPATSDLCSPTSDLHSPPPALRPQTSGLSLLSDLRAVIQKYLVLPPMAAEALALWVVHTYAFAARNVTVYIGIVSPEKRCGKTTLLTLLANLANRSLVAANITPSALFRAIEEPQPTLLIDEADTFLQARDEFRGILNAGYKRDSAYVVRVVSKKRTNVAGSREGTADLDHDPSSDETQWTPLEHDKHATRVVRHSCWCPKVIAAIGRLPDTLADRCIVITMQRKTPAEHCERMRDLNAAGLRSRCLQFFREHRDDIAKAQPALPPNLNDRAADIWEPLLAIADIAGGEWPDLARKAALRLSAGDEETTLLGYFLYDLRSLFTLMKSDRMFSRNIVEILNPMHDRPWEDLRRGREISEWWLSQHLNNSASRAAPSGSVTPPPKATSSKTSTKPSAATSLPLLLLLLILILILLLLPLLPPPLVRPQPTPRSKLSSMPS